ALGSGRRAVGANALAAAAAGMLIADPGILTDVGFLLSASATSGLLAWQAPLAERLRPLPTLAREGIATTLAATAPSMPLVAAFFGRISLVSPLANVIAVPLFPPLMLAGAATSAVGVIALDAARPLALAAYALATALRAIVETTAALPFAAVELPSGPGAGLVVGLGVACCVLFIARGSAPPSSDGPRGGRAGPPGGPFAGVDGDLRPLGAALEGAVRVFGSWRPQAPARRGPGLAALALALAVLPVSWIGTTLAMPVPGLRVLALDVGQGDAFLVHSDGQVALIDGGPDPVRLLALLSAHLAPWQRRIDLVVITHAHLDHGAGLLAVLDRYEVGLAIEPERLDDVPLAALWAEALARSGVPRRALSAGMRVHLGAAVLTALSPNGNPRVTTPNLVLRLERGEFSMLFTADAEDAALADLLLAPERLRARVYVPPHHGAATPHGTALADAVRPELALLSVGASNRYGHPTPETLAALGTLPVYRTDRDGTVEIAIDGPKLSVRTGASGLPPPRGGRVPGTPPSR
ncbi:MAG: ComEC/Rec2 family competence protein, partial [Candidatus Limnocylindria bacterium]